MGIEYTINISKDALNDITSIKRYILNTFRYREYAQNFSIKIKKSIQKLKLFPRANKKTEYSIERLTLVPGVWLVGPYSKYGFAQSSDSDMSDISFSWALDDIEVKRI